MPPVKLFICALVLLLASPHAFSSTIDRCRSDTGEVDVQCAANIAGSFIRSWIISIENEDLDAYVAHYAPRNSPIPGQTRAQWEAELSERIRGINRLIVELDSMGLGDMGTFDIQFVAEVHQEDQLLRNEVKMFLAPFADGYRITREINEPLFEGTTPIGMR